MNKNKNLLANQTVENDITLYVFFVHPKNQHKYNLFYLRLFSRQRGFLAASRFHCVFTFHSFMLCSLQYSVGVVVTKSTIFLIDSAICVHFFKHVNVINIPASLVVCLYERNLYIEITELIHMQNYFPLAYSSGRRSFQSTACCEFDDAANKPIYSALDFL